MAWNQGSWGWGPKYSNQQFYNNQADSWYGPAPSAYKGQAWSEPYPTPKHSGYSSPGKHAASSKTSSLPSSFVPSDACYDSTALHGLTLNKNIEATHWSRKRDLAARDVLEVRAHELFYHGTSEWSLRLLSHGRFISTVPTRSVAESVFVSQLLAAVRKNHVDLDAVAEAVWKEQNPERAAPAKNVDAPSLYAPFVDKILGLVKQYSPEERGSQASQQVVELRTRLEKRENQLRAQGVELSPAKTSGKTSATSSDGVDLPVCAQPTAVEESDSNTAQSLVVSLNAIQADILKPYVKNLSGTSVDAVQAWLKTFKLGTKSLLVLPTFAVQCMLSH